MQNAIIGTFGDSYTHGYIKGVNGHFENPLGVSTFRRFARSGSTAQQWAENKDNLLADACSRSFDVMVGSLGGNDAFAAMADCVVTDTEKVVALASLYYVLRKLSCAHHKIILLLYPDPFWGAKPEAAAGRNQLVEAIAAVARFANAQYNNIIMLDLSTVLGPQHFDGVDIHPNEDGYKAMASAVTDLIDRM